MLNFILNHRIVQSNKFNIQHSTFNIESYKESYIKGVLSVAEKQVGKRFIDHNWLKKFTRSRDAFGIVALTEHKMDTRRVTGFCFAQTLNIFSLHRHILLPQEQLAPLFPSLKYIGYISLIAIDETEQNKGIGGAMLNDVSSRLLLRSEQLITVVWKAPGIQNNFGVLLEKRNWKPIIQVKEYWKEDSRKKKYHCAVCGKPPCRCCGVVYLSTYSNSPPKSSIQFCG